MSPATRRKNVVLPAPSGPMRAKSSPRRDVEVDAAERGVRPEALHEAARFDHGGPQRSDAEGTARGFVDSGRARRASRDRHLRGLAGDERLGPAGVEVDLRGVDEVHALLARLDRLRRELGVGRDLRDVSREELPGERVDARPARRIALLHAAELRLGDERAHVEPVRRRPSSGRAARPPSRRPGSAIRWRTTPSAGARISASRATVSDCFDDGSARGLTSERACSVW